MGVLTGITAVIATHNRADQLRRALESLQHQTLPRDRFEAIVVANACTDDSLRVANEFAATGLSVRVVEEPRLGLHHARHAGARAASRAVLAYTDDDCLCSPQWLERLLRVFENENVGCAGGPINPRFEDCAPPAWFKRFPAILGALDHGDSTRELRYPEDLYGGNFAIRRDLLFSLGGFDPDAFGPEWSGAGETALLRKVYRSGKKVVYAADAMVEHVIPAEHTTIEYAVRRIKNHASAASVLACDGEISKATIRLELAKFRAAALFFRAARALMTHGSEKQIAAHIYAEYAQARAEFDRGLLHEAKAQELVTRTDWLH